MSNHITIAGRKVGAKYPPYLIAELSCNHNGDVDKLLDLVHAADESGADAVKFQLYTASDMTIECDKPDFRLDKKWGAPTLYELYKQTSTPFAWVREGFALARRLGITPICSVFSEYGVGLLESLDCPAYKIANMEAMDGELVAAAARTGKPLIISTGLLGSAALMEMSMVYTNAAYLHCVSDYPTNIRNCNIARVGTLDALQLVTGLSSHTRHDVDSIVAIANGASIIEKHFTLDRNDGGPDAPFSFEPEEFSALAIACHDAWVCMGDFRLDLPASEGKGFMRSIRANMDIRRGDKFTRNNIRVMRPGGGLSPNKFTNVLNLYAKNNIERGDPIKHEDVWT